MNWQEYVEQSARTDADHGDGYELVGLFGELGELVDLLKKDLWHGVKAKPERVLEEVGDVLWHIAVVCRKYGVEIEKLMDFDLGRDARGEVLYLIGWSCIVLADDVVRSTRSIPPALSAILKRYGYTLEDAMQANIDKLQRRYPEGFVEGGGLRGLAAREAVDHGVADTMMEAGWPRVDFQCGGE
jgi:NTP pyrophosphatase (non-canonical NTP hydrolase)